MIFVSFFKIFGWSVFGFVDLKMCSFFSSFLIMFVLIEGLMELFLSLFLFLDFFFLFSVSLIIMFCVSKGYFFKISWVMIGWWRWWWCFF